MNCILSKVVASVTGFWLAAPEGFRSVGFKSACLTGFCRVLFLRSSRHCGQALHAVPLARALGSHRGAFTICLVRTRVTDQTTQVPYPYCWRGPLVRCCVPAVPGVTSICVSIRRKNARATVNFTDEYARFRDCGRESKAQRSAYIGSGHA